MTALSIPAAIQIGLDELATVIDLGGLSFHVELDRSIPTAELRGDTILVNDIYYESVNDHVTYLGQHEGLHHWFGFDNPTWQSHLAYDWQTGWAFVGPEAWQAYGGPVPVDPHGHILLPGMIMSGVWPVYRDQPQVLSAIELAMLTDMGVHVWSEAERIVNSVYHDVLGREADDAGRDWWVAELEAGHVSQEGFRDAFIAGIVL